MFFRILLLTYLFQFAPVAPAASTPAIIHFSAEPSAVAYKDVESGAAEADFTWHVIGVPSGLEVDLHEWVGGAWMLVASDIGEGETRRFPIFHPQDFAAPTFRLSVANAAGVVSTASYLQFDYILAAQPPEITFFSTDVAAVNADLLARGEARILVTWEVSGRLPNTNLIFEQILADGSAVNVELPRQNWWIPSRGQGAAAPVTGGSDTVDLRLSLVNIESGEILTSANISLPIFVPTPIPQQPTVQPSAQNPPPAQPAAETTPPVGSEPQGSVPPNSFTADVTAQGAPGSYIVTPGDPAGLHWSISGVDSVYIFGGDDFGKQGPFPASGSLSVCPRSGGTTYRLTASNGVNLTLTIYVPSSLEYPAYSDPNAPACWK